MSKALGSVATLHISNDGSSWTLFGNVIKVDMGLKNNAVDATDNDDAGFKSKLYGDQMSALVVDANYNPSDAGQAIAVANLDQSDRAEGGQRLAYRRPAHAQQLRELAFRRQALAGRQPLILDQRTEALGNLPIQGHTRDRPYGSHRRARDSCLQPSLRLFLTED